MARQGQPITSELLLSMERKQLRLHFHLAPQLLYGFLSLAWGRGEGELKNFSCNWKRTFQDGQLEPRNVPLLSLSTTASGSLLNQLMLLDLL